jgi:pantetheine-phosphate adenylyltransferase
LVTAIYPGSFDPFTNGHLDVATRSSMIFDKLIIAVYARPLKNLLFNTEERVELTSKAVKHLENVEVHSFDCLVVDYARQVGAGVMVRGLRMTADFEREFEIAMMNRYLDANLEMITMMSKLRYQFLSSSMVKEVAELDGSITDLVPEHVAEALREKARKI